MSKVLFVSEQYMRDTFFISDNVESKYINQAVSVAQDIQFQEVIGETLYEKLKQLIIDKTIGEEENKTYKKLINKSQMFIGFSAVTELSVNTTVKLSNAGLNRAVDTENFQVLQNKDMFEIRKYYENQADFYKRRLQEFLLDNRSDYPELSENRCHQMHANLHSAESSGIWLGGKRGKGRYCKYRRG